MPPGGKRLRQLVFLLLRKLSLRLLCRSLIAVDNLIHHVPPDSNRRHLTGYYSAATYSISEIFQLATGVRFAKPDKPANVLCPFFLYRFYGIANGGPLPYFSTGTLNHKLGQAYLSGSGNILDSAADHPVLCILVGIVERQKTGDVCAYFSVSALELHRHSVPIVLLHVKLNFELIVLMD